jgi:hypothetical protein
METDCPDCGHTIEPDVSDQLDYLTCKNCGKLLFLQRGLPTGEPYDFDEKDYI